VVSKQDRMINPDLERFMAERAKSEAIELPGSHAIFLSHAPEVAAWSKKRLRQRSRPSFPQCLLLMLWTALPPVRECHGSRSCLRLLQFGGARHANGPRCRANDH
jgi:hypothetical protein